MKYYFIHFDSQKELLYFCVDLEGNSRDPKVYQMAATFKNICDVSSYPVNRVPGYTHKQGDARFTADLYNSKVAMQPNSNLMAKYITMFYGTKQLSVELTENLRNNG